MRKFFNYMFIAAIATTVLAACSKSDVINEEVSATPSTVSVKKVNFSAKSANPGTKSHFGDITSEGYPTVWTNTQNVSISLNYGSALSAGVVPSSDGKTATFDATISQTGSAPYVFYALSPAVAAGSWNSGSVTVNFPATQTPTMASVDEAAHIMFAKSESFDEFPSETTPVSLAFSHIAAYGKMMLKNFHEFPTIQSIDIESESENIVGSYTLNPETGAYTTTSGSKKLTINASAITAEKNSDKVFWFAVKPVDLRGKKLKVTVHTDNGDYAKNITFPTTGNVGNFQAGRVAAFNVIVEKTATIHFGSDHSDVEVGGYEFNKCQDSQRNSWTVDNSRAALSQETGYTQIGKNSDPATGITFTTELPFTSAKVTSISTTMASGNDDEIFHVTLDVNGNIIGEGNVQYFGRQTTISSNKTETGTVLTITVSSIYGAVRVYDITIVYE